MIIPFRITIPIGFLCIISGFILLIVKGVTEITSKNKTPSEKDYAEARKAYEEVTRKQKQGNKPPWEK